LNPRPQEHKTSGLTTCHGDPGMYRGMIRVGSLQNGVEISIDARFNYTVSFGE
jgi:hypothetical protein